MAYILYSALIAVCADCQINALQAHSIILKYESCMISAAAPQATSSAAKVILVSKPEPTSSLTPQPWLRASRRVLRSEEPCHRTLEPCVFLRKATRVCSVALTTSLSEAASRLERCCNSSVSY